MEWIWQKIWWEYGVDTEKVKNYWDKKTNEKAENNEGKKEYFLVKKILVRILQLRSTVSLLTTGWVWLLLFPWHSSSVFSSERLRCSSFIVFRDFPGDISSHVSSEMDPIKVIRFLTHTYHSTIPPPRHLRGRPTWDKEM